ncbi:MAG: glycosyltransferase family 4 protein [Gemmatimonadota bacterium]|nr:glycosyltransferase family 4 protein [Gemmatimonadota bacterium]
MSGLTAADPDQSDRLEFLFLDSWVSNRAEGSGSAVAIAGLAAGLRSLGHRVEVLRPRRVYRSLDATRLLYNLTLRNRLADLERAYDVVVGFDYDGWALHGEAGALYAVALKGVAADERRFETGWYRLKFTLWSALEGRNARSADRVFVTSEYSRKQAVAAYALCTDRVRLAPEGTDPAVAAGDGSGGPEAPTVLSVARQYRRKDTASLIRAVPGLLAAVPRVRVRIVGDGPELRRIRRLVGSLGLEDAVSLLGALQSVDALRREYERASVFCLPSLQEGFGIVFLEAMSHGLPIVAAAAGAVPEVAPHGETSLLVPPGDCEALTRALTRILTEPGLAGRLGRAGRERAARYDWTSAARAFVHGIRS